MKKAPLREGAQGTTKTVRSSVAGPLPLRLSGPSLRPLLEVCARFLNTLAAGEAFTFQTFDDSKRHPSLATVRHGSVREHADALARLNRLGAGVHVMVNAGDGKGRAKENVIRVRAMFIDLDGAPLPLTWPLEPHLLVESSPGRFHAYWRIKGLPLHEFKRAQKALALLFGGDESVCDLPRVMRLPGFYHCKGKPVSVKLLRYADALPYSRNELLEAWPEVARALAPRPVLKERCLEKSGKTERRYALSALQNEHDRVASAPEGTRNATLNRAAFCLGQLVGAGALERASVEDALQGAASMCGLPRDEAVRTIKSGLEAGFGEPRNVSASNPQTFRQRRRAQFTGWRS